MKHSNQEAVLVKKKASIYAHNDVERKCMKL